MRNVSSLRNHKIAHEEANHKQGKDADAIRGRRSPPTHSAKMMQKVVHAGLLDETSNIEQEPVIEHGTGPKVKRPAPPVGQSHSKGKKRNRKRKRKRRDSDGSNRTLHGSREGGDQHGLKKTRTLGINRSCNNSTALNDTIAQGVAKIDMDESEEDMVTDKMSDFWSARYPKHLENSTQGKDVDATRGKRSPPTKPTAMMQKVIDVDLCDETRNMEQASVVKHPTGRKGRRPAPPSAQPNFILIDDSSDEEMAPPKQPRRNRAYSRVGNGAATSLFSKKASQKDTRLPDRPRIPDTRFRPHADFNFGKSMKEALDEQEGLFRQAAANLYQHEDFLRNMHQRQKSESDGPTFTRAVDPTKLRIDHWKWQCPYARLGLPKDATDAMVKRQYRKHALRYHPDKCRLEDASSRFHAVTEAYNKIKRRS